MPVVTGFKLAISGAMAHSCSKKLPCSPPIPNSFGTWPMMVTHTRPWMKPFITGAGIKLATQPMRASPSTRNTTPTISASAEVIATYSAIWVAPLCEATTAPTVPAEISAVAESGPMTMVREVPKIA